MALQHFYTRVPARLSMFNRTDGYDTFACSNDLTLEYIEKELAPVYDNNPTKNEAALIREGKLRPVYCQKSGKNGELIQSCVSFISKDYTGERSSYLVHSLVLDDDDKNAVSHDLEAAALNPDMFVSDLSTLDIDAPFKFPNDEYQTVAYKACKCDDVSSLAEKYEPKMLKFMIHAVISVLCGKGKTVFPVLNVPHEELSETALSFMNTFMQIIPYHMRPMLSFVTDAGDTSKYSAFKIRFLPENVEFTAQKGMGILFGKKAAIGIKEEEVSMNMALVDFFYGLIINEAVRREFLIYVDSIVTKNPALAAVNSKNLSNLVFLFKQCSGLFPENTVLPNDDKLYDLIAIYDKYRSAMTDEYRVNTLKCLQRYPQSHREIPKKVFSKVTHFYPTEPDATKRVIMNVVLDLIHTDLMRDRLFSFIKNVYHDENDDVRAVINSNLISVYYGGFLQNAILDFFTANFDSEPEETRAIILEKLFLTLRTPAIQPQIVEFIRQNYSKFTQDQKRQFYMTFFELLADADSLAEQLTEIVNKNIAHESDEIRSFVAEGVCRAVEKDRKRKAPKVMRMLVSLDGYCTDCVTVKIFTDWIHNSIFAEYLVMIWDKPIVDRIKKIARILNVIGDAPEDTLKYFLNSIKILCDSEKKRSDLIDIIEAENILSEASESMSGGAKKFSQAVINEYLHLKITEAFYDIFSPAHRDNDFPLVWKYAKSHAYLTKTNEFKTLVDYLTLIDAVGNFDVNKTFELVTNFPKTESVCKNIAQCLRKNIPAVKNPSADEAVSLALSYASAEYLENGVFSFKTSYDKIRASYDVPEKQAERAEYQNDTRALKAVISAANVIYLNPAYSDMICSDASELSRIITDFVVKYGSRGEKFLRSLIWETSVDIRLSDFCTNAAKTAPVPKTGLFKKIFGK